MLGALVFVVGDVFTPGGGAVGDRQVGHEVVGGGAVPVPFVVGCVDAVAGADLDDRLAPGLVETFAFGDLERLAAAAVAVPRAAGARGEVDGSDVHR